MGKIRTIKVKNTNQPRLIIRRKSPDNVNNYKIYDKDNKKYIMPSPGTNKKPRVKF